MIVLYRKPNQAPEYRTIANEYNDARDDLLEEHDRDIRALVGRDSAMGAGAVGGKGTACFCAGFERDAINFPYSKSFGTEVHLKRANVCGPVLFCGWNKRELLHDIDAAEVRAICERFGWPMPGLPAGVQERLPGF